MFKAVRTNSPLTSAIPTLFIVIVGMIKEAYLEYKRHRDDKAINRAICSKLTKV